MSATVIQQGLNAQQEHYAECLVQSGVFQGLAERIAVEMGGAADPPLTQEELNLLTDEQREVLNAIVEDYRASIGVAASGTTAPRPQSSPQPSVVAAQPQLRGIRAANQQVESWGKRSIGWRRDYVLAGCLGWLMLCLPVSWLIARMGVQNELDHVYTIGRQCQLQLNSSLKP